jgi:ABC-type bacteriocin/lantibiotic exporter with double-glycine peptidase domain
MNSHQSIACLSKRLWQHIGLRRRQQFGLLLLLMLFASFAEVLSIGAVLPFLSVLTAPDRIFVMHAAQPLIQALNLSEPKQLLLPLSIAFSLAALTTGAMRLLLLWASTRLSYASGADLSVNIYRRTLYQPYAVHCARNSSQIVNGVSSKVTAVIVVINMTLTLISSGVMLIAILVALLAIDSFIAITAFGGFGLIYAFITKINSRRLLINSQHIARESDQVVKSLQEGLGGIRDILIDGSQEVFCNIYRKADYVLRDAAGSNTFIGASPRFVMESLGMILIAILAFVLAQQTEGIAKTIPILGALALGAQRLLPLLQQAYGAWTQINSVQISLKDTLELLDQPLPAYANKPIPERLSFNHDITLKQIDFRYDPQGPYVLKQLNFTIAKGSRVGFIGATGSGKSTLLDIVMGLLQPTNGLLEIDGHPITPYNQRAWQLHIAHVPQTIFLVDSTIEENIAFGEPKDKIDQDRVRQAAQQAQIAESIESWPKQYQTLVGERGVRLSGGQRQRVGIARALYKQADVIIFDEATSALDNETEQAVMDAIEGLSKELTVLIIAHRLTTLKSCTHIMELHAGGINCIGNYQEIVNKSTKFVK